MKPKYWFVPLRQEDWFVLRNLKPDQDQKTCQKEIKFQFESQKILVESILGLLFALLILLFVWHR